MATPLPASTIFRIWSHDVLEIKELLYSHKYKRCAARCEELQVTASHPIHKTFLYFYQALCYESLGVSAHVYSANKLSLLHLAKDSFALALQSLPEPHSNNEDDKSQLESPKTELNTLDCATLDVAKRHQVQSPSTEDSGISPRESEFSENSKDEDNGNVDEVCDRSPSSSVSSIYEFETTIDGIPDFDAYSPRRDMFKDVSESTKELSKRLFATPSPMPITRQISTSSTNHKVRLSQSLSSTHCLADDLVPTPLFKRTHSIELQNSKGHTTSEAKCEVDINDNTVIEADIESKYDRSSEASNKPAITTSETTVPKFLLTSNTAEINMKPEPDPNAKPLPPLPFKHNPSLHNRLKSKKSRNQNIVPIKLIPSPKVRATAIQTLVAQFENKINPASPRLESTPYPKTPITPRFRMIEQTFTLRDSDAKVSFQHISANETRIPVAIKTPVLSASRSTNRISLDQTPDPNTPCPRLSVRANNQPNLPRGRDKDRTKQIRREKHSNPSSSTSLTSSSSSNNNDDTISSSSSSSSSSSGATTNSEPNSTLNHHIHIFKQTLLTHLTTITNHITTAQQVQDDHRQQSLSRCLSFWSFDVDSPLKSRSGSGLLRYKRDGRDNVGGNKGTRRRRFLVE